MQNLIYSLIERLLPLPAFKFMFMKNALLAILMLCPMFGLIGTMVVDRKMAFFSDALGHSVLAGIALGILFGVSDPQLAMALFAICFAYLLNKIRRAQTASADTIISVFSASAMALGLALLSKLGGMAKYSHYLVGDILTVDKAGLTSVLLVFLAEIAFFCITYNKLFIISTSPLMAVSRGIRVRGLETLFIISVALVVTVSIRWVGILLINSMLALPAATARNFARSVRAYIWGSVLISLASGLGGLIISFYAGLATGPTIILCGAAAFFITYVLRRTSEGR